MTLGALEVGSFSRTWSTHLPCEE